MKSVRSIQLKWAFYAIVICSLIGLVNTCTAQEREKVKAEHIQIGKTKPEVVEWAKSINKYNSMDEVSIPNLVYLTINFGKLTGRLDVKLRYEYIFKNDSCQWINIYPGTMNNLQDIMSDFKKTSDGYVTKDGRIRIAVNEEKRMMQASKQN